MRPRGELGVRSGSSWSNEADFRGRKSCSRGFLSTSTLCSLAGALPAQPAACGDVLEAGALDVRAVRGALAFADEEAAEALVLVVFRV